MNELRLNTVQRQQLFVRLAAALAATMVFAATLVLSLATYAALALRDESYADSCHRISPCHGYRMSTQIFFWAARVASAILAIGTYRLASRTNRPGSRTNSESTE